MDRDDDELFGEWFERGEQLASVEVAFDVKEMTDRRARVGLVIAAISATVLTLVLVFGGRV